MRNLFIVLLTGAAFLSGCKSRQQPATVEASESAAVNAAALTIKARPFASVVPVTGTLISRTQVQVRAETIGRVAKFPKEEGERVRAGEPVLWVEEENYRLALKQAESSVQVAEAALARSRVLRTHSLAELERAQNLIKSGGITDKDLQLAIVTEQDARSQVRVAEAQLEQARSAVDIARKKLADAVIRAPVDGEIQTKFVNIGAYVEAPTPVFSLIDNRRLELEAFIPSSELAQVRPGMRVTFTVNSYPGESFEGIVIELAPALDAGSRSAKIRVSVSSTGRLRAGMFAEGKILTGIQKSAIVIPTACVYRDDRGTGEGSVFIVENGVAVRRKLNLGREYNGSVEVLAGLHENEVLIAEQSLELAEGVRVQTHEGEHAPQ